MSQPNTTTNTGSLSYAWVGLLIGFALLAIVVWQNAGDGQGRGRLTANPDVLNLTSADWQKEVVESKLPVVLDFWAPRCPPCLRFAPTMDKLAALYAGRVKFCKINVDDQQAAEIADKFGISMIPALFIHHKGEFTALPPQQISEAGLTRALETVLETH